MGFKATVAVALLARFALWASPLQPWLAGSLQASTPLTSAARRALLRQIRAQGLCSCRRPLRLALPGRSPACSAADNSAKSTVDEGAYWLEAGQSPYAEDARIVYQPPMLLFMHSALRALPSPAGFAGCWSFAMLSLADMLGAVALRKLASPALDSALATARPGRGDAVAAVYLFNPQVLAACVAGSTSGYSNAATLLSLSLAVRGECSRAPSLVLLSSLILQPTLIPVSFAGRPALAATTLAVATYLSVYPAMLLLPIVLIVSQPRGSDGGGAPASSSAAAIALGVFAAALSVL